MPQSADDFLDGGTSHSADSFLDGSVTDHSNIVSKSLAATVSTPFQLPKVAGHQNVGGSPFGGPRPEDVQGIEWKPEEQEMAGKGIDITSGAPYGLRNRLSMLVEPSDKETRDVVNDHFGKDVGLARNQYGELEYTNPETGRRTLLNSKGKNLPNLAPTAGGTADFLGSAGGAMAAGLPTAAATGNPVLAGVAASAGAGIGQSIVDSGKTIVNSYLGVGNKPTPDEQIEAIAKHSVKTAALTAVGETIGMIPAATRWAGRGFLDLSYSKAKDLQQMAKEAALGLDDYNTLIGSQAGVKPSISELVPQDPKTRIINEKAYKSTEDLTAEEEKRINSNLDTLSYNYKNFTDAFKPEPGYQYGSSGYNIQQEMEAKKAAALSQQQLQDSVVKADAKAQTSGLPAMTETERNQELTDMLNRVEQAGKAEKDKAYGDLKVSLGVPKETAYDRTSGQWLLGRKTEDAVELTPVARAKIQNIWQEAQNLDKSGVLRSGDKYYSAIPEAFLKDVNHPENGLVLDGKYDILSLIDNVQDLNSGVRAAMAASRGRIPADEAATAHVAEILKNDISFHLRSKGDPRILDKWEAAQQANQQYEENFGRGIINQVMKRTGGFEDPVYNSATAGLLMRAGKGQDQSGVAKFAGILNGAPDEKERVRNMIWSIYKDHYMPTNGIPDQKSWAKYTAQMEGPMKYFFTDSERGKMQSFSDMTQAVADSSKKLAAFNKAWRASPEYGGIPTTSQGLSNAVFREGTPPQVLDKMIKVVGSMQPELLKQWKADTANQFARRVSDASGMPVDSLVSKYINQYGDRLSKVMGPQYVANLRTYQKVAQMVQGGSGVKLDPDRPASVLTQVIRAKFAPPMSAEGRWYSALLNWRKQAAGRVVYNALKSPDNLDKFVQLKASQAASPIASGILGQLKGQGLGSSLFAPQPEQDTTGQPDSR